MANQVTTREQTLFPLPGGEGQGEGFVSTGAMSVRRWIAVLGAVGQPRDHQYQFGIHAQRHHALAAGQRITIARRGRGGGGRRGTAEFSPELPSRPTHDGSALPPEPEALFKVRGSCG